MSANLGSEQRTIILGVDYAEMEKRLKEFEDRLIVKVQPTENDGVVQDSNIGSSTLPDSLLSNLDAFNKALVQTTHSLMNTDFAFEGSSSKKKKGGISAEESERMEETEHDFEYAALVEVMSDLLDTDESSSIGRPPQPMKQNLFSQEVLEKISNNTKGTVGALGQGSKMLLALGGIGLGITGISAALVKSSGILQSSLAIGQQASMLFFKPYGDFLGLFFQPMALHMIKLSVETLKFFDFYRNKNLDPSDRQIETSDGEVIEVGWFADLTVALGEIGSKLGIQVEGLGSSADNMAEILNWLERLGGSGGSGGSGLIPRAYGEESSDDGYVGTKDSQGRYHEYIPYVESDYKDADQRRNVPPDTVKQGSKSSSSSSGFGHDVLDSLNKQREREEAEQDNSFQLPEGNYSSRSGAYDYLSKGGGSQYLNPSFASGGKSTTINVNVSGDTGTEETQDKIVEAVKESLRQDSQSTSVV